MCAFGFGSQYDLILKIFNFVHNWTFLYGKKNRINVQNILQVHIKRHSINIE